MDRNKDLHKRLSQMNSYFQGLVNLIPPRNYYSQTADEGKTTEIEDDVGLLTKVLNKPSHIKTISKKDGKLIKPTTKKENKHKLQEEKVKSDERKNTKKLSKKRLMRREDIVEIIKKQKADDSGVETIGSVDLEDSKDPVIKTENVIVEKSRLEDFAAGEAQVTVNANKSDNVVHNSFEEDTSVNIVKEEDTQKQFKVPEKEKLAKDKKMAFVQKEDSKAIFDGETSKLKKKRKTRVLERNADDSSDDDIMEKQVKDKKTVSEQRKNEKVKVNGETSKLKKKRKTRESEANLDGSSEAYSMQMSEVPLEEKLGELEQAEKQDEVPIKRKGSRKVEEQVLPAVDKLKASSTKKKKKKEADQEREGEGDSKMEVVSLEEEKSDIKTKKKNKKRKIEEDRNDHEGMGKSEVKEKNGDDVGEEEMVLDLGDFEMSDLGGSMEEEGKDEEVEDETKEGNSDKRENLELLELREKMRSKIQAFEMQRKAKDGNEKKNKQKKLKAKMKKLKKQKRKEALAAKKGLKEKEEGDDETQKVEVGKEKEEVKDEEENKLQFSQLEFDSGTISGKKRKSKKTKNMVENQTGKNYKVLLDKVEKKKEKYERLKAVDPALAVDWLSQEKWRKAVLKAQGEKIKDDPELLKKSLKRTEKRKKRSRQKMKEMQEKVLKSKKEKQQKRNRNLQEKQNQRKAKKTKRLQKKGKLLLADRDKI